MGLRRRRVNDEVRDGVAKTMVIMSWSRTARVVVGKRPECCGRRRDSKSVAAVASLHEEEGKGHYKMRRNGESRRDQRLAARAHLVDAGEPNTAR